MPSPLHLGRLTAKSLFLAPQGCGEGPTSATGTGLVELHLKVAPSRRMRRRRLAWRCVALRGAI